MAGAKHYKRGHKMKNQVIVVSWKIARETYEHFFHTEMLGSMTYHEAVAAVVEKIGFDTLKLWLNENHDELDQEEMIKKIHGIDRHKKYSTISVLNREGQET